MAKAASSSFALAAAGACSVTLVAALGTFAMSAGASRGSAALSATLLSLLPAILYGALSYAAARIIEPRVASALQRVGFPRFVTRDAAAPRDPVILFHAAIIALALALGPLLLAGKLLLARLRRVENDDLRELLSLVGVIGVIGASILLACVLVIPLRRGLTAFDRRVRLPIPASPALRSVVWLGAPLSAIAIGALRFLEPVMGPLVSPLWLVLVLGVQVILHALLSERFATPSVMIGVLACAVIVPVALAGANGLLRSSSGAVVALEQARPGNYLVQAARVLSDVDRDGASALFGDRDCAAFSSARSPLARDIPGNGIDEDCDGADQKKSALPKSPTFLGGLTPSEVKRYDIAWFIVDAVRADHTSLLGYNRQTTPRIDELASESLVFEQAFSQSSATMLSIPSILGGIDPARVQWTKEGGTRLQVSKDQRRYISAMLAQKGGYRTGFVVSRYFKTRLPGLLSDWDWIGMSEPSQTESSSSGAAEAVSFIHEARKKSDPFLLVTYLPAPHTPYVDHGPSYPKAGKGKQGTYDGEIMNADRYIGFVLDVLRQDRERWANTIVIFTSDHGEELGEHGGTSHSRTCHVESTHVPLLVRIPGQVARRVERPVQLIDIVPTLLELVGLEVEGKQLEGSSLLLSARAPERLVKDRPLFCTIISQKAAQGSFARRSVRSGKWKLMTELRGSEQAALYDVVADPDEKKPVSVEGERVKVAEQLGRWLRAQLTGNVHLVEMLDE